MRVTKEFRIGRRGILSIEEVAGKLV